MHTFLDDIKELDNPLAEFIEMQLIKIYPLLENIGGIFTEYTDHSKKHSQKVLELGSILNANNQLSKYEKAVFILASFFHDVGMNVSEDEFKEYTDYIKKHGNYDALAEDIIFANRLKNHNDETKEYFLALDYFRINHAKRSHDFISKNYPNNNADNYFDGIYIWDAVKRVCYAHTVSQNEILKEMYPTDYPLGNGITIDLLYLSLLLRLGDICHYSRDRAFPYFFRSKDFLSEKSESIWKYYADIVDTIPNLDNNIIDVKAICENFFNHRAILNNTHYIQQELEHCHLILANSQSKYQFPWKIVSVRNIRHAVNSEYDYYDTKFRLNYNKIVHLLMGEKLYRISLFAIRECIQNSLDSLKILNKKTNDNDGYILINYLTGKSTNLVLDVYDIGTGMDKEIVNEFFLSVGSISFWYSKRCYEEWGANKTNIKLIADHGIGALSYFMIADKIEIFSIYQRTSEAIHVEVDNYQDGIVFKKTPVYDFPSFDKCGLTNPWDKNHGTCLRFHLKERIDEKELLGFLAKHILRPQTKIFYQTSSNKFNLSEIWHYRDYLDNHCFGKDTYKYYSQNFWMDSEKSESLENLYEKLYKEKDSFFNGPPNDPSISDNFIKEENISGNLNINYKNNDSVPCRISQAGILIEDAVDFIVKRQKKKPLLLNAFGFDIDLPNTWQFQLDAERTRIIESKFNISLFEKIYHVLEKKYFEQISKIEYPVFFPCGGIFYHGIIDVLFEKEGVVKCFHKNLKNCFDNYELYSELNYKDNFDTAQLYLAGLNRNYAISVDDIKGENNLNTIVLLDKEIIKKTNSILEPDNSLEKEINNIKKELKKIQNQDTIVFLPENNKSFMWPLFNNFDFEVIEQSKYYCLIQIHNRSNQPIDEKIKLFNYSKRNIHTKSK